MKLTINGVTFEGTEAEIAKIYEAYCKKSLMSDNDRSDGEYSHSSPSWTGNVLKKCPRGRVNCMQCEYALSGGLCSANVYMSYPPKYDRCHYAS